MYQIPDIVIGEKKINKGASSGIQTETLWLTSLGSLPLGYMEVLIGENYIVQVSL